MLRQLGVDLKVQQELLKHADVTFADMEDAVTSVKSVGQWWAL